MILLPFSQRPAYARLAMESEPWHLTFVGALDSETLAADAVLTKFRRRSKRRSTVASAVLRYGGILVWAALCGTWKIPLWLSAFVAAAWWLGGFLFAFLAYGLFTSLVMTRLWPPSDDIARAAITNSTLRPTTQQQITIRSENDGLVVDFDGRREHIPWTKIVAADVTTHFTYVLLADDRALRIPSEAFGTNERTQAFVRFLMTKKR